MTPPNETKGLTVAGIHMVRCSFNRLGAEAGEGVRSIRYSVTPTVQPAPSSEHTFSLELVVHTQGIVAEAPAWICETVFAASFRRDADSEVTLLDAQQVHGPAILYGFAREHVFDLVRRAGMQGSILPPLNFMTAVPKP